MQPLLLLVLLSAISTPALAIYKCQSGDRTVYSDIPCYNSKTTDMKEIDIATPSTDAGAAQQKLAQDKKELQRLESVRKKQEAADERAYRKTAKANEAKKKKCTQSALRKKWADEDVANAHPKSAERAKRAARRVTEKHELECGA